MDAEASGAGVRITLSGDEKRFLGEIFLEGILKIRDISLRVTREIPITLARSRSQEPPVEVGPVPNRIRFGEADSVDVVINSEYYERVRNGGMNSGTFYDGKGNLTIYS